ncbi:MAG TPA: UDP-3-O-(3-hydroxymyristoyl)glucosamine N-acyltransferase [Bdellovibrionales bacterium]|nr:UDP-3-O-(3-hydroxymyristoyl)glucosamine N-acyltransferase [Bdellovibrionales bacterium]
MSITCRELKTAFPGLIDTVIGDESVTVTAFSPVENVVPGAAVFASDREQLELALKSQASVVVAKTQLAPQSVQGKTLLLTKNVPLAQALIIEKVLGPLLKPTGQVHVSSFVAKSAKLGARVTVGAFAVIGDNCVIGDDAYIGAGCVLEYGVHIGLRSKLVATVYVGPETRVGEDCVIHPQVTIANEGYGFAHDEKGRHYRIPQRGRVVIEDRVEIGSHCNIDRATFQETRIASGTKFDAHVHIAHNCSIGRDGLITAGLVMGGSSHIGNNVVMGGNVTITDHVKIADRVQLGGLSGVAKDITEPGAYGGYPLQPMKDYLRTTATMTHLVQMRKDLSELVKKVLGRDA